ncbi:hypothetical protein HN371_14125 [Candidatus Poribacteria bacterium]|nr:hypothetical protein [Candidatus Poribacteria bacterium]MBT5533941.1 hypothetical protein [Candidatus Poribacteria bacterium]MBT5715204.1 hypothetical protein [Candidatus Poribacteria bacterium]MBT7100237.1 hypothetical protein [Candidatus Poribacteria bacterium]MBT7806121.1 hypothetical protein [Candidatus Poribacteria bacterium]
MRWPALAFAVLCAVGCAESPRLQPPVVRSSAATPAGATELVDILPIGSIGGPGAGPGQFREPSGLVVGPDGALYVADPGNHRVVVVESGSQAPSVLGSFGWDSGEFDTPDALALSPVQRPMLYIAERGNRRVQVCDVGNLLYRVVVADAADERLDPAGLAVGRNNELYVTDAVGHRVWRIASNGAVEWTRGGFGQALDRLDAPSGIALDARGGMLVSDTGNSRLVRMDFAGNVGDTWRPEGMESPGPIAWSAGRWYVCDRRAADILVLDDHGSLLLKFGAGAVGDPSGVAVREGTVYVSDRVAHDIKVFRVIEASDRD